MTLQNMERQVLGKHKPLDRDEHDRAIDWMQNQFWIYDYVGSASSEALLECFEYAARKYGIKHFVLDSMLKLRDVHTDDYLAQENLLNRLNDFAKLFGVHMHVVCHSKKPDSRHPKEKHWPGEYDIKGSGSIPDLAWNVICMWRNEEKAIARDEAKLERTGADLDEALAEIEQEYDALVIVQKQRTTGLFPIHKQLWFDASASGSWQFSDEPGTPPVCHMGR